MLSFLGKIPGIGPLFSAASMAAEAVSGQLDVAGVAAGGGSKADILNAERDAAIGLGSAAVGLIVPGMGKALMKGVEKGGEAGATAAADAVTKGVEAGAGAATRTAESVTSKTVSIAGHDVEVGAIKDSVQDGVKDTVKDTVKDNIKDQIESQVYGAVTGQNQNQDD